MAQDETSRSGPHRRVERILDRMHITYESEHTEFRPYSLDIYLPEWHLGIEVDGPAHSKTRDSKRDAVLREKYYVPVLRLSSMSSGSKVITEIEDFIVEWAGSAKERKWQHVSASNG